MTVKTLEDISDSFALFDSWEDRYRYLIDLGRRLPPMSEDLKTEAHRVKGCTSQVWLVSFEEDGKFSFVADSDAQIVRGLIYLLFIAYSGKDKQDIKSTDIERAFQDLGLDKHLSPNRRNGFFAMVERIKALADA